MTSLSKIKYAVIGLLVGGALVYFFAPSKKVIKTEVEVVTVEKIVEVEKVVEKRVIEKVTTTPDGTVVSETTTEAIDRTVDRTVDASSQATSKSKIVTTNSDKRLTAMVYYDPFRERISVGLSYNIFGSVTIGVVGSGNSTSFGLGVRF